MTEVDIKGDRWLARATELKADGWWLADLCGLDRLSLGFDERFGVVARFLHRERKERMVVHIAASGEPPTVQSICSLWSGANFFEREAYDMFGIKFEGHPDLKRILMPDEWEGHPLRKDYGVGKVEIDFVPQPFLQIQSLGQSPKSKEAMETVDDFGQTDEGARRGDTW